MKWDADTDTYTLECSGRSFYANRGLVSIHVPPAPGMEAGGLGEGYDGSIEVNYGAEAWTFDERRELATAMIERWKLFAAGDDDAVR